MAIDKLGNAFVVASSSSSTTSSGSVYRSSLAAGYNTWTDISPGGQYFLSQFSILLSICLFVCLSVLYILSFDIILFYLSFFNRLFFIFPPLLSPSLNYFNRAFYYIRTTFFVFLSFYLSVCLSLSVPVPP